VHRQVQRHARLLSLRSIACSPTIDFHCEHGGTPPHRRAELYVGVLLNIRDPVAASLFVRSAEVHFSAGKWLSWSGGPSVDFVSAEVARVFMPAAEIFLAAELGRLARDPIYAPPPTLPAATFQFPIFRYGRSYSLISTDAVNASLARLVDFVNAFLELRFPFWFRNRRANRGFHISWI